MGHLLGSCVGFGIVSDLAFATIRSGDGARLHVDEQPDLGEVGSLVMEWLPRPDNPFQGRLYHADGTYTFWSADAGWFRIEPSSGAISMSPADDALRRELRLFGIPTALCAFHGGDITVHASAVEIDGQAVLFAGPSRYGKTTLAAAFARAGHRLLTEDSSRCRVAPVPAVYPGPAALRLRADVAASLTIPRMSVASRYDDRVALVVAADGRGDGAAVPLRIVVVPRLGAGVPTLQAASVTTALRDLMALTFRPPFAEMRAMAFARVTDLAQRVEVVDLIRPMTMESLGEVIELIERRVRSPSA